MGTECANTDYMQFELDMHMEQGEVRSKIWFVCLWFERVRVSRRSNNERSETNWLHKHEANFFLAYRPPKKTSLIVCKFSSCYE